jgi:hypothetical protein
MVDAVGEGVFVGEPAAVVGRLVVPLPLHPPVAVAAEQEPAQLVGLGDSVRGVFAGPASSSAQKLLGVGEGFVADDRRVDDPVGGDPLVDRIPGHLGDVAVPDVVDVEEHFLFTVCRSRPISPANSSWLSPRAIRRARTTSPNAF